MTLDRPVHAPKTADGGTANEAGVVYVYRVKARTNTPTGMRPRLGAYALARRPVRLRPGRPSGGNSRRPTSSRPVHLPEGRGRGGVCRMGPVAPAT